MNIKTLLLGSAAALAAVSGAHAADAIVAAEPEPLEYVRICDAYGKGYFYIPGTETCLQIGGKVRTEASWGDVYSTSRYDAGTYWHTRAELNVNTATDTEYGPLKTATVLRFDYSEGSTSSNAPLIAYISLGGFLVGRQDSQYNDWIGYAGDVINDDVIGDGPYELNQLTYLYDSGTGFTGVISLEDSNSSGTVNGDTYSNHYAPDGVLGLGYKAGAWSFKVVGGYDSVVEEGAIKARIDADFGSFSAFVMGAWNTDGDKVNKYANGDATGSTGDWTVWGGWSVPFTEKLKWSSQVAYADNKTFEATTNLQFHPVKDLLIEPEVSYVNYDSVNTDRWAGILRFQRSF